VLSRPAVIKYKKLNAELFGDRGHSEELLLGEIEVRPIPVVKQHGSFCIAPHFAHKPALVQTMEHLRQVVKTVPGIHKDGFRRIKRHAFFQFP
jgi:hypothetical protein